MKKFLLTILTVGMLASSVVYGEKQAISAQEWEKQHFAALNDEDKKAAIMILRSVKDGFEEFGNAVDKGGESFLKAFESLMNAYTQLTQVIVPRLDMYKNKLGLINALTIVPSLNDVQEIIQDIFPKQAQNEREIKRGINKALRNKNTKQRIKDVIAAKCTSLAAYVELLEKNYAAIIESFEKAEKLIKRIKDKAENGQDFEQILSNMSDEERKELMQLLV